MLEGFETGHVVMGESQSQLVVLLGMEFRDFVFTEFLYHLLYEISPIVLFL